MPDVDSDGSGDLALANTAGVPAPHPDDSDVDQTLDAEPRGLPSRPAELERNSPVGRYLVVSRIGAGAMGVVYAAYDPDLDRRVALKLLQPRGTEFDTRGHQRLLREAQAMAKLSHPNVLAVHDVGEHDGRVFVAMEYVEGQTLGDLLEDGPLPWRRALELFEQAGRGLQAAHAEGLVHRDFKPDNAMVDHGGRVRVMDFGLVRPGPRPDTEAPPPEPEPESKPPDESTDDVPRTDSHSPTWQSTLTQQGAIVGTPAFMAPEQHAGKEAGPAADQFAWCVSLWAALFGRRPFSGDTLAELATNITLGKIDSPPPGPSVPGWLRRTLLRGLSTAPEDRWPSVQAVLDALARGRVRARVGVGLVALAGAGAVAAGIAYSQQHERGQRIAACERAGASIEAVWGDAARAELRSVLQTSAVPRAATTADKVIPRLDAYATAWSAARTDACLEATVHERWEADTLERATWCFDERRMELEAFVAELMGGELDAIDHAVEGAAELARIAPCGDADLLSRLPAPPKERRDEVLEVRRALSRVRASRAIAAYERGLTEARDALEQADALQWPPLTAAARRHVGDLLEAMGQHAEAAQELETAYFEAIRTGAGEVALAAAEQLVVVAGYRKAEHRVGLRWARHADVLLDELADAAGLRRADHLTHIAVVRYAMGEYEEAAALHGDALSLREATLDPDHPAIADSFNDLGLVRYAQGRFGAAGELYERALAIRERAFGSEHLTVAKSVTNLATVRLATGAHAQARALLERALAISTAVLGADHPQVATVLANIAVVHQEAGELDEAAATHERVLAMEEATLGPEHPAIAGTLGNLGNVELLRGRLDRARTLHERALAIREAALGPTHADVGASTANLARVHVYAGELDQAIAMGERAVAIFEAAHGADAPPVADASYNLAGALRSAGQPRRAAALFDRAVATYERTLGPQHEYIADALTQLGKAELEAGEDERAEAALRRAREIYEQALGDDEPGMAATLATLAELALRGGRTDDARALAERALARGIQTGAGGDVLADARFALARATWQAGRVDEAIATAELARDGYRDAGAAGRDGLAKVEEWLALTPDESASVGRSPRP